MLAIRDESRRFSRLAPAMDEPAPDGKSTPRYVTWRDGRWRDATLEPCWYATMDDVLGCRTVPPDYPKRFCNSVELLWGPIRAEVARLCQAPAAAASVLLRVDVCKKTLEQVEQLIPEQVRCRPEDTADSLCRRLSTCRLLLVGFASSPSRRVWSGVRCVNEHHYLCIATPGLVVSSCAASACRCRRR